MLLSGALLPSRSSTPRPTPPRAADSLLYRFIFQKVLSCHWCSCSGFWPFTRTLRSFSEEGRIKQHTSNLYEWCACSTKEKRKERTLEKWHFSLHFSLFAISIDSCELTVPVVHVDINTEKLANALSTSCVGAQGSKSSHVYRCIRVKEKILWLALEKEAYGKSLTKGREAGSVFFCHELIIPVVRQKTTKPVMVPEGCGGLLEGYEDHKCVSTGSFIQ